jgi:hypothetical protein
LPRRQTSCLIGRGRPRGVPGGLGGPASEARRRKVEFFAVFGGPRGQSDCGGQGRPPAKPCGGWTPRVGKTKASPRADPKRAVLARAAWKKILRWAVENQTATRCEAFALQGEALLHGVPQSRRERRGPCVGAVGAARGLLKARARKILPNFRANFSNSLTVIFFRNRKCKKNVYGVF